MILSVTTDIRPEKSVVFDSSMGSFYSVGGSVTHVHQFIGKVANPYLFLLHHTSQ